MIQLNPDYLIFEHAGKHIPCSAELATLEMMGPDATDVDSDLVKNASAAVLHYFKHELNQESVSVADFAQALQKVFHALGIGFSSDAVKDSPKVEESDLERLAKQACGGAELFFFSHLRAELIRALQASPRLVRFYGLRECAMLLAGARRWNRHCQAMSDLVVDFLRTSWIVEPASHTCTMIVS